jgi:sRNA-binding carbon storage regulator CsrA
MLLLGRREGEGLYVGRFARLTFTDVDVALGEVDVAVEHDANVAVSLCLVSGADHLSAQVAAEAVGESAGRKTMYLTLKEGEDVRIGRGVVIQLLRIHPDETVRVGVEAPRHVAVSRDDFTLDEHLRFQEEREGKRRRA